MHILYYSLPLIKIIILLLGLAHLGQINILTLGPLLPLLINRHPLSLLLPLILINIKLKYLLLLILLTQPNIKLLDGLLGLGICRH